MESQEFRAGFLKGDDRSHLFQGILVYLCISLLYCHKKQMSVLLSGSKHFVTSSYKVKSKFLICFGSTPQTHTHLKLTSPMLFDDSHTKLLPVPQTHQVLSHPRAFRFTFPCAKKIPHLSNPHKNTILPAFILADSPSPSHSRS